MTKTKAIEMTEKSAGKAPDAEGKRRTQLLLVLFLGVLMAALDIAIIGPALPTIQQAFGTGDRAIGWVFSIYVLANLVGTPLMARLSDLYGRRLIYVLDVLLFALGSLIIIAAPTFALLLVGRAVQGFGAGGIFPVASAVIGDTFPPEKRGGALGLIGAVFGLAFIVGPILGGVLLGLYGWQSIFWLNVPLALVVMAMAWRLLPGRRMLATRSFDWAGMAVLAVMLVALAFGLNQLDTTGLVASLFSPEVGPWLLLAVLLTPLFLRIEAHTADPILPTRLFRNRQIGLAASMAFGAGLGEAAVVFLPAFAVAAFGVTSSTSSYMLLPLIFALFIGSPLSGRLLDRIGSRAVILGGTLLLTSGMLLYFFWGGTLAGYYGAGIAAGLGLSALLGAPIRYIMINETVEADRASAQAIATLFTSIGQLVGAAVVGAVVESQGGGLDGYSAAYLTIAVVAATLAILAVGLKPRSVELVQRAG